MNKLNLLLLVAVFASALVLVDAAYDTRRLRSELHRAEQESERLDAQRKQLEAERQQLATSLRVDSTARQKLGMRPVTPAVTMYESQPGLAPGAASAPSTQGVLR